MKSRELPVLLLALLLLGCATASDPFDQAKAENTVSAYEAYVAKYPDSEYATEAMNRLAELKKMEADRAEKIKMDEIQHQLVQLPAEVHFAFDSSALSEASIEILQRLSAILRTYTSLKLQLVGHADLTGEDQYNVALSKRRVEQVRNWLVASGLPADRFVTAAMGKSYPLLPGRGASNGAHNRRVEFVVLDAQATAPHLEVTRKLETSDLQPFTSETTQPTE